MEKTKKAKEAGKGISATDFFDALEKECSKEGVYSVVETIENMNINCQEVLKSTDKNEELNRRLQKCITMCGERLSKKLFEGPSDIMNFRLWPMITDGEYSKDIHEFVQEREYEKRERKEKEEAEKEFKKKQKELKRTVKLILPDISKWPQEKKIEPQNSETLPVPAESEKKNWITQWHEQRASAEEERLKAWRAKQAKENLGYQLEKDEDKSDTQTICIKNKFDKPALSPEEQNNLLASNLCTETGVASTLLGGTIFSGAVNAIKPETAGGQVDLLTTTHEALFAMEPRDIFEGMLCSRIWVLHNQAMRYMQIASNSDITLAQAEWNINSGTKLMRLANETLDALNKHRRKGEQKVTVQHVNVNNGGQAIVNGQLNQGEGEHAKK